MAIGPGSFTCLICAATSSNPNDARARYCGQCHVFVDDLPEYAQTLLAERAALRQAVVFFASAIKSGEPWTDSCERVYRAVLPRIAA